MNTFLCLWKLSAPCWFFLQDPSVIKYNVCVYVCVERGNISHLVNENLVFFSEIIPTE